MGPQELRFDEEAVGKERQDQRQLDEEDNDLRARVGVDDVEQGENHPGADREHGDGEDGPVQPAGESRGRAEEDAEDEERFREPDVHRLSLREGRPRGRPSGWGR